MSELHGTATIKGSERFQIPAEKFVISPLPAESEIHIVSLVKDVEEDRVLDTTAANDYTFVKGSVPYVKYYINTTAKFYIKW